MAQKYYAVWKGRKPGIYDNWDDCKRQVDGYTDAKYKSFPTRAQAQAAFREAAGSHIGQPSNKPSPELIRKLGDCYAVDAAASGSPGPTEYQCVHVPTGRRVFRHGPFADGTNNVGEFLAVVEALALFYEKNITAPLYSDSKIALGWLKEKKCKTNLARTSRNRELFDRIKKAEHWLQSHSYPNKVLKWETEDWGENPADFGRK